MATETKQKAALYIRVSTSYQIDKDSLPLQRQDLINYANYALGIQDYEIFEDAGYSAKNTDRPAYQNMMTRIRAGEFSHLMVWKIDRISRNLLDFASMYAEIKKLGVIFVSKNEQFDTSSAMGEAMLKIILVFAELGRNMTSERVSAVMLSRANNGLWNGGKIPFGYDLNKEDKTFTINESEAETVRFIYNHYEKYHSLLALTKKLNEQIILTREGNAWSPVTVNIIMRNPFYTGALRYNYLNESNRSTIKPEKEWVFIEDHHPAIISTEQYDKCNAQLMQNSKNKIRGIQTRVNKNVHIFAGLLRCSYCDSGMIASSDRARPDGYRPSMYVCSRKRQYSDCPNKYISDVKLGPFIFNYIANMLHAQKCFTKSTPIKRLEKILLRGESFGEVKMIDPGGLQELYHSLRSGIPGTVEYTTLNQPSKNTSPQQEEKEKEHLIAEKRKKERALSRLKNLYLYDEDSMSEKDYLIEKKQLTDLLDQINDKLGVVDKKDSSNYSLSDEELLSRANLFVISQKLTDNHFIDYQKFIKQVDAQMVKEFINSTIENIYIKSGKVTAICFKNSLEHKFIYK